MAIVTAHVAAVQQLYVAYFNRPADYAGLDYWTNVVAANNGNTTAVSAAFAGAAEYKAEYANLNNAAIVSKIYQNLFGRAAETAGRDYWADLLTRNVITIDKVVAEIAKGARNADLEAYENKVTGATAFTNALDTPAERTGYAGAEANAVAKTFLASITTDASLATATAPAALSATVAASVKAGTPFTLVSGLAALEAAEDAVADFLADLDLDGDGEADEDLVAGDVTAARNAAVADADAAVEAQVGTAIDFTTASPAVRAALIEDATAEAAATLAGAEEDLADAQEALEEVEGLAAAVELLTTAQDAEAAATAEVTAAQAAQAAAEASFEVIAKTTVTYDPATGLIPNLIVANATTGALQLATAAGTLVTTANKASATALLNAIIAHQAALDDLEAAEDATLAAQLEVNLLDKGTASETSALATLVAELNEADVGEIEDGVPTAAQIMTQYEIARETGGTTLTDFEAALGGYMTANETAANNPLSSAVTAAADAYEDASEAVTELAEAVAGLEAAQANVDALEALQAAVTAAREAFPENDFRAPVTLGASAAGTAGSDIFLVGDAATTTITSFGRVGSDALFIGNDYVLNTTGKLTSGDNSKLEVFFVANTTGVRIHLETEVYGSDSAAVAEQVITLTGVSAADLVLENGIITVKGAGA